MVKKAVRSVATLLHTQMPSTIAFSSMCSILTFVEVEVETKPPIVIVSSNTSLVLQLSRQDVRHLFPFSFAFALSFGALLIRLTGT